MGYDGSADAYSKYDMKAYAHKLLIKEDISIRVSQTINKARFLFYCLSNAVILPEKPRDRVKSVQNTPQASNIHVKRALENRQQEEQLPDDVIQRRIVSINAFNQYITEFYGLWLGTKDQIGDNWARKGLKNEIKQFLESVSYGRADARRALELFEQYMTTLTKSGITDIKYYSYKPEEVGRESI